MAGEKLSIRHESQHHCGMKIGCFIYVRNLEGQNPPHPTVYQISTISKFAKSVCPARLFVCCLYKRLKRF